MISIIFNKTFLISLVSSRKIVPNRYYISKEKSQFFEHCKSQIFSVRRKFYKLKCIPKSLKCSSSTAKQTINIGLNIKIQGYYLTPRHAFEHKTLYVILYENPLCSEK